MELYGLYGWVHICFLFSSISFSKWLDLGLCLWPGMFLQVLDQRKPKCPIGLTPSSFDEELVC